MKKIFFCFVFIFLLVIILSSAYAESKEYKECYTYRASEMEGESQAHTMARIKLKEMIYEGIGGFYASRTKVKDYLVISDEIVACVSGNFPMTEFDNKWDGKSYYLCGRMTVDTNEMEKSLNECKKDYAKTKELEAEKEKLDYEKAQFKGEREALMKDLDKYKRDFESWKEALASLKETASIGNVTNAIKKTKEIKKEYDKVVENLSSEDILQEGLRLFKIGKHKEAMETFDKVIKRDPKYSLAYAWRGYALINLGDREKARRDFEKAIELRPTSTLANYGLGSYYNSLDKYDDYQRAAYYYKMALESETDKGNIRLIKKALGITLYNMGLCLKDGREVTRNIEKAFKYFTEASEDYNENARFELGKDFDKAIKLNPQNAFVYYSRGNNYNSLGYYQAYQRAVDDYNKALELETDIRSIKFIKKALAISLYNIAACWKDGREVPKNDVTAFKYFAQAAEIGNKEAQFELGIIYSAGILVPSDKVKAYMWWNLAAAQGHYQASIRRNFITLDITTEEVQEAQRRSSEFIFESERD